MSSKMVVRILSISMALLLFGMVVPSLSDAATVVGEVDLGPVLINSTPGSEIFTIKNEDEQKTITLNFNLPDGAHVMVIFTSSAGPSI